MREMLVVFLLSLVVACYGSSGPEFEEFASDYVKSVYAGTELYKRYTPEANREVVEESRRNMAESFEFTGRDYAGAGNYEYGVKFANGATGVVAISEREGEITEASLIVTPPPKE